MSIFERFKTVFVRFLGNSRAGATSFVAVAVTIMTVGGAALIIDHDRLIDHRDLLKSAADATSMSATLELEELSGSLSDAEVRQRLLSVARKYAVLNVVENVNDPDLEAQDIRVTLEIDRPSGTVGATVGADIGKALMSPWLLGYSGPGVVTKKSGVESLGNAVEVVLAIDISQSMKSKLNGAPAGRDSLSRMDIVKRAAADLVDILNPNEESRVAVAIVPWQLVVRLDETTRTGWIGKRWTEYPRSRHYAAAYACEPEGRCTALSRDQTLPSNPGEEWLGCLDEHRVSSQGHADLPRGSGLFDLPSDSPFAQSIFTALQGVAYRCMNAPLPGNLRYQVCYDAASPTDPKQWSQAAQRYCDSETAPMLPLTTDRTAIDAAIAGLKPVGIRTYSALGVLWGSRMLSHSWKDVWGSGTHPVDPGAAGNVGTRKAIVLLTDGEDNQCGLQDPSCETNDTGVERSTACTAAKMAGIEVFVIAAMHPDNVSRSLGRALRGCSSEAEKPEGVYAFLNNADPESLRAAFADIARQLRTIRRIY